MIHVYEIPEKRSDGYCFNGGNPITFLNVDWMNSHDEILFDKPISDDEMLNFIRTKQYIKPGRKYLVLDRDRLRTTPRMENRNEVCDERSQ